MPLESHNLFNNTILNDESFQLNMEWGGGDVEVELNIHMEKFEWWEENFEEISKLILTINNISFL